MWNRLRVLFGSFFLTLPLWAQVNFKADRYRTNLDTQLTEATGNVVLNSGDRVLRADTVVFDGKTGVVDATGQVRLEQGPLVMTAERARFDMIGGLGAFEQATLRIQDRLYVEAKRIERTGVFSYRAERGKLSTCMDCPQAWSIGGAVLEIEVEGFAEIQQAVFQIKDLPFAYFPVLVFPIKTQRQSGFLLPTYSFNQSLGHQMGQSYYWAPREDVDATAGLKWLSRAGVQARGEFRYAASQRSFYRSEFSVLKYSGDLPLSDERWGYSFRARDQLSPQDTLRIRSELASDSRYVRSFPDQFSQSRFPSLDSDIFHVGIRNDWVTTVGVRLRQDAIVRADSRPQDHEIYQLPDLKAERASQELGFGVFSSSELRAQHFFQPESSQSWRSGARLTWTERLSRGFQWGVLDHDVVVVGRGDLYGFDQDPSSASRARMTQDQVLSATGRRRFELDANSSGFQSLTHSITPFLRWSSSLFEKSSEHPFFEAPTSFDLWDPHGDRPLTVFGSSFEELRLRRHDLLQVGLGTRVLGDSGTGPGGVTELLSVKVDRDVDLDQGEFGRIRFSALAAYWGLSLSTELAFDTKTRNSDWRNAVGFVRAPLALSTTQVLTATAQTYVVSGSLRSLGPVSLDSAMTYDALTDQFSDQSHGVSYASPSKCWLFSLRVKRTAADRGFDITPIFTIAFSESGQLQVFGD